MGMDEKEKLARQRFMTLNIIRFIGVACTFAGVANIAGKLFPDLTPYLGYVLLLNGAVDVLLAPALLKRVWAKQDSNVN
jgi:hypothetical protein